MRSKKAGELARQIVREIHRRGLAPGDKLLAEHKMVERYGVARGSLREALRFLELQGVLEIKTGPGGGPVVRRPDPDHLAGTLALLLQFEDATFRSIIEARWAIEPRLAALAAARATPEDHARMRASLDSLHEHVRDDQIFEEENRTFHDLVAAASGSAVFAVLVPALHRISTGATITYSVTERRSMIESMEAVCEAIVEGDEVGAERAMDEFFSRSLPYLERRYPERMGHPIEW